MIKRAFDIFAASIGLLVFSPFLITVMFAIWIQDWRSPFYVAPRAARGGGIFHMVKFRTMVVNADKIGGSSTAATDRRITPVGQFVRAYKLDELIQLWNVLKGDMSLVGPRPQVLSDTALYTSVEKRMLSVPPGITDPASIVFSDEGEILKCGSHPDLLYNQIIRPWKSRLALANIDHRSFWTDLWLNSSHGSRHRQQAYGSSSAWSAAPQMETRPACHPYGRAHRATAGLSAARRLNSLRSTSRGGTHGSRCRPGAYCNTQRITICCGLCSLRVARSCHQSG